MNLQDWINTQIDVIKNCVDCLTERKDNMDALIIQLWALKKHVDSILTFLEKERR